MNKSIKIWLNYIIGATICVLLLYTIHHEIKEQLTTMSSDVWQNTGSPLLLLSCIALMLVNSFLESYKWYTLVSWAEPVKYKQALASYLAGIAFSIITPNRIGEYPGRILYMGGSNTFKYINISVSGIVSQLAGIYCIGFIGLVYYNLAYPAPIAKAALAACILINILIALVYWRFEAWLPYMAQNKYLRRFALYGKLMNRVSTGNKIRVLALSILRVSVFTAQYLFLLRWLNVEVPVVQGFCLAALFFWIMAVVPSLALTELGVRGAVSLYVFRHVSTNTIGILAATGGIWLLNLIVPSVLGSILIIRMKWLK